MKAVLLLLALVTLAGCGAVMSPFMVQLDADQQKVVDGMWNNMFTPPARLDRELLLDVLCEYQVLQLGADRMHVTAEKYLASGNVMLEADFDRANPDADEMTLTVRDAVGHTVRRERYLRREINARIPETNATMRGAKAEGGFAITLGDAATQAGRPETAEEKQSRVEREKRQARIEAATQPAVVK